MATINVEGESFGQRRPPLYEMIKNILREYPSGQIFKEIIQNADDARATQVKFFLDCQQKQTLPESLLHLDQYQDTRRQELRRELHRFNGPALVAFNDAPFKKEDWESIQTIHQSGKAKNPHKVGKFGIGFNSVYHITDLPVILSENYCGFLDPQEEIWKGESGKGYYLEKASTDAFSCFEGLAGFTKHAPFTGKTLLRFPLRNQPSKLSPETYTIDKMRRLLHLLQEEAKYLLIFLRSVCSIEVVEIDSSNEQRQVFKVSISKEDMAVHQRKQQEFISRVEFSFPTGSEAEVIRDAAHFKIEVVGTEKKQCDWIVVNQVGSKDPEVLKLAKKQHVLPWVGTAYEISQTKQTSCGRIFCFLPLPVEDRVPFLVHINGTFAISSNRRSLKWEAQERQDEEAQWNALLVSHCLPSCYVSLLHHLVQISSIDPAIVYNCWPDIRQVKNQWKGLLTPLYRELLSSNNVVHTKLNGGQWIPVSNAIFSPQKDVPPNAALEALLICNQNVVQLPSDTIWNVIEKYYGNAAIVSPSFIQAHLKHNHSAYTSMGHNNKLKLLAYCLKNTQYQHMIGLKLIPLLNDSFEQFNAGYYVKSNVYYVCTASNRPSLLPAMSHCLVDLYDTNVNRSLHNLLLKVAESGLTQLKVLEDADVAKLLPQCDPESWSEQQRKKFWDWLRNKNLALFTNQHIVPVRYKSSNSIMPLAKARGVVYASKFDIRAQSSHVLMALDKLGIKIADASVFTYLEHHEILNYLYHFEAGDILDALNGIAIPQCTLSDSQAISLQRFFSNVSFNGQRINAICELPIFSTIQGEEHRSSITSLKPDYYSSAIVEGEHFDFSKKHLPSSPLVISSQGNVSSLLSKLTGQVRIMNGMEYLQEYVFPDIQHGHLSAGSEALMKDIVSNYYNFHRHYGSAITMALSSLNFIPVSSGEYKSPSALYDPKDSNIVKLYNGKSVFPSEYNGSQSLQVLRQCGLKSTSDIAAKDINDIVVDIQESCSSSPVWCGNVSYGRSKAVLLFLTKHANLLKQSVDSGWYYTTCTLTNKLISCAKSYSWLPVSVAPPSEYPSCIPWRGSEYSDSLASTECKPLIPLSGTVANSELPIIVGSQAYFIENVPSQLCSQLRSSTDIIAISVVDHLQAVIENKSEISHDKLESMVYKIYEYLSKNITSNVICKLKCLDKWVWVENLSSFLAPSQVAMSPNASLRNNLEPFMHVLSRRMQSYSKLLTACNVANTITSQHILSILQHIQNSTVQISKQEAWSLVRTILEWVVECEEVAVDGSMLVPVESESQYPQLKEACEVAYTDNEVFLSIAKSSDEEYTLIHPNVAHLAPKLGLTPLSDQLDITEDVFEDAGQHEPLIMRIKNILREYKDGLTIIKELIQNADDAEATEVNIVYDARNHTKKNLFIQEMGESHGPALVIHNNKMFTDEDFENITKLAAATKKDKALKIGKFGIGFCSVYHMTDVPSFISRDWLYIFDPTLKHLKSVVRNESRPGKRIKYLSSFIAKSSQLAPYKNLFNFNPSASYNGTMFRLPFRQHASEISSTIYNEAMISQLKYDLSENGSKLLLFLKHVKRITFSSINESGSHMTDQLIIERHNQNDGIRTLCSTNTETNKVSNETWLISSHEENLAMGSVACKLEGQDFSYSCASVDGGIYCFLPLNVPSTGLPVHVNANFAVRDNRSGIWTSESQYMNDQEQWNHQLMDTTIATAYCNLLLKLKQLSLEGKLSNYNFFSYWPLMHELTSLKPWDKLVESLYGRIANECLFLSTSTGNWQTLNESKFLHSNILVGGLDNTPQCVFDAICQLELPVVFLPSAYQLQFFNRSITLNIIDEIEFVEIFFSEIAQFTTTCHIELRNNVLLAMFKTLTVQHTSITSSDVQQYLEKNSCIPCTPKGVKLKFPNQLVDPSSRYCQLFDKNDEMFPMSEFTRAPILSSLKSLGLMSSHLSWDVIIECAKKMQILYSKDKKKALKSITLIMECIRNNLSDNVEGLVPSELGLIPFLPVSEKPAKYPSLLEWKGTNTELLCPSQCVYNDHEFIKIGNVIGSQRAIINKSTISQGGCGYISHSVIKHLNITTKLSFHEVLKHYLLLIKSFQDTKPENAEAKQQIEYLCRHIYEFLDNRIAQESQSKNVNTSRDQTTSTSEPTELELALFAMREKTFLWTGQEFTAPINIAIQWQLKGPQLYKVPDIVALRKNLVSALHIQETFPVSKLLGTLHHLYEIHTDRILPEELHPLVDEIMMALNRIKVNDLNTCTSMHEIIIVLPDCNHALYPVSMLSYNDAPWIPLTDDHKVVDSKLNRETALALGVTAARGQFLEHYCTKEEGIPFGQHEELTTRIKNILRDYPLDETFLKELLQNADDAKATKMCVILDKRTHKKEKIPSKEWEELQGPALLVWNDANFTDDDIKGIQKLGLGSKRDDSESIGQFGIGFNVVYHITDCPSFMTGGDTLCIFDPHCRYAPKADIVHPGRRYDKINDGSFWTSMADLGDAYLQSPALPNQPEGLNEGTLFRFPLRCTKEQVENSKIVETNDSTSTPTPLTAKVVEEKLNKWLIHIKEALLFLNNITQFQFFVIDKYNPHFLLQVDYKIKQSEISNDSRKNLMKHFADFKLNSNPRVEVYPLSVEAYTPRDEHPSQESWLILQGVGDIRNASQKWCFMKKGVIPKHGIAASLSHSTNGKAYCFLPLTGYTNLPVHINGQFVLDSTRRALWNAKLEYDERKEWNDNLIEAISSSYVYFLEEARKYYFSIDNDHSERDFTVKINRFYKLLPYYTPEEPKANSSNPKKSIAYPKRSEFEAVKKFHNPEREWKELAVLVFNKLWNQNSLVLASKILSIAKKDEKDMYKVKWHAFQDESAFLQAYFILSQDKKYASIFQSLGMTITCAPENLYSLLVHQSIQPFFINRESVFKFYTEYHLKILKYPIPCHIEKTPFNSPSNFCSFLSYTTECITIESKGGLGAKAQRIFSCDPNGYPLLLTADSHIRMFDASSKVLQSNYHDLFSCSKSKFLSPTLHNLHLSDSYFLTKESIQFSVVSQIFVENIPHRFRTQEIKECLDIKKLSQIWEALCNDPLFAVYRDNILKSWALIPSVNGHSYSTMSSPVLPLVPYRSNDQDINDMFKIITHQLTSIPILDTAIYECTQQFSTEIAIAIDSYSIEMTSYDRVVNLIYELHERDGILKDLLKGDASIMLNYFSRSSFRQAQGYMIKSQILSLPLFKSFHGNLVPLINKQVYLWPDPDCCDAGYEIWAPPDRVVFLERHENWRNLCGYDFSVIGGNLDKKVLYYQLIFPCFNEITPADRMAHLEYIRDNMFDDAKLDLNYRKRELLASRFLLELKALPCLESSKSNALLSIPKFCDHTVTVFTTFPENYDFLPNDYRGKDWLKFFRELELKVALNFDEYIQMCSRVSKGEHINLRKASRVLLDYLFSEKAKEWHENDAILYQIGNICFVEVANLSSLTWIKAACQPPSQVFTTSNQSIGLTKLNEAVEYEQSSLIWTVKPVVRLPEPSMYIMSPEQKQSIWQKLGLTLNPASTDVYNNIIVISNTNLANFNLFFKYSPEYENNINNLSTRTRVSKVMLDCFEYLVESKAKEYLEKLKDVPCIPVEAEPFQSKQSTGIICKPVLVSSVQVVHSIEESDNLLVPYINSLPSCLYKVSEAINIIGVRQEIDVIHIQHMLQTMHKHAPQLRTPNQLESVRHAILKLHEILLNRLKKKALDNVDLYLSSHNGTLAKSTELLFVDSGKFECPVAPYDFSKCSYMLFQIPLKMKDEDCFEVTEMDFCLRLPRVVRPKGLSLCCEETVLNPIEVPNGLLETHIMNLKIFCQEIKGLLQSIIHCKCGPNINQEDVVNFTIAVIKLIDEIVPKSIKRLTSTVVLCLPPEPVEIGCIKTEFVYQGSSHPPSLYVDSDITPTSDTWKDMAQTFCIEVARSLNADLTSFLKYASSLSKCLKVDSEKALKSLAKKYKADMKQIQSKQGIKPTVIFEVGTTIPSNLLAILDYDINLMYRSQEWVGYMIKPGVFIYAIIQHPIIVEHELEDSNPLKMKYQILIKGVVDLDGEIELVEASALDLYRFIQKSDDDIFDASTALVPVDDSIQFRNAGDSIKLLYLKKKICAELKLLWNLQKEEQKKAINRMIFHYHPDKCRPEDARLYEDAFKYLLRQLDRLKQGQPLEEPSDITEEPENPPDTVLVEILRQCETNIRTYYVARKVTYTLPTVSPNHAEALRWLRQAECDFKAMEILKSNIMTKPSVSCQILFLAHEVVEKALKGGMYKLIGLYPYSLTHHYLPCHARAIASEAASLKCGEWEAAKNIPHLIAELGQYYIDSRFPNSHPLPKAPVDVYELQPHLAITVAENAEEVLKIIQDIIRS